MNFDNSDQTSRDLDESFRDQEYKRTNLKFNKITDLNTGLKLLGGWQITKKIKLKILNKNMIF